MPAAVTVGNLLDVVNGDVSSISALQADDGGDGISLREAIEASNGTPGSDEVNFSVTGTIVLDGSGLEITDEISVNGPGRELLTIDAQHQSRIINYSNNTGNLDLNNLSLVRGSVDSSGAGIRFMSSDAISINNSDILYNYLSGDNGSGGGIYSGIGQVSITHSNVSGNSSDAFGIQGVGLHTESGNISISHSTFSNNTITGTGSGGGAGVNTESGGLLIESSEIYGNSIANGGGAGISTGLGSSLAIENSSLRDNIAGGRGGGIFSVGVATIINSSVENNTTTADESQGGGIYSVSGLLSIVDSSIEGNKTLGNLSPGGGIYSFFGTTEIVRSSIARNSTVGLSPGGGVYSLAGTVLVSSSTIDGNYSEGRGAIGGGIATIENFPLENQPASNITFTDSSIIRNYTLGYSSSGGGIYSVGGSIDSSGSTISGNFAEGEDRFGRRRSFGGGIYSSRSDTQINNSTVTDNRADFLAGGVYVRDLLNEGIYQLNNAILSGNTSGGAVSNLAYGSDVVAEGSDNLLGSDVLLSAGGSNLVDDNPGLAPLAHNGGPTFTHALLPGSPAIDAGDPSEVFDPLQYDQRGFGYHRVADGGSGFQRIDIGAYEAQSTPLKAPGDYNQDGLVDAADYTSWRDSLGTTGLSPLSGADGDGDGQVTQTDFEVWASHYGFAFPARQTTLQASSNTAPATTSTHDNLEDARSLAFYSLLNEPVAKPTVSLEFEYPAVTSDDSLMLYDTAFAERDLDRAGSSILEKKGQDSDNEIESDPLLADGANRIASRIG